MFISVPIAEKLYAWLSPILGKGEAHIDDENILSDVKDEGDDSGGLSLGKLFQSVRIGKSLRGLVGEES